MCLSIPMELIRQDEVSGTATIDGVEREVSLMLLPEPVEVGEFILVHAGYAIAKIDPDEAKATLNLLREAAQDGYLSWDDGGKA